MPFPAGPTSYILHVKKDNMIRNVEYLSRFFPYIQLLFFGRGYLDAVMAPVIIERLTAIQKARGVRYLVHLPLDLDLLNPDDTLLDRSLDVIRHIKEATKSLAPSAFILHIDRSLNFAYPHVPDKLRRRRFPEVIEKLRARFKGSPEQLCIENLTYDLTEHAADIRAAGFSVCMDTGHLQKYRQETDAFIQSFADRIRVIHIHGETDGKDHRALGEKDVCLLSGIYGRLKNAELMTIIEVFSKNDLTDSIKALSTFKK